MSYDLHLHLKSAPMLTREGFAHTLEQFGLCGELAPDFSPDCNLSPLCAKLWGILPGDSRAYLAPVDCTLEKSDAEQVFALPTPPRKLFRRRGAAPTLVWPAGGWRLTFSCGMDSLEYPFALLLAVSLAGEDGLLYDPTAQKLALGSDIALLASQALDELRRLPVDRQLLHEFEEWI